MLKCKIIGFKLIARFNNKYFDYLRKLTQLRCEIVQRIYGAAGPSPEIIFVPSSNEPIKPPTILATNLDASTSSAINSGSSTSSSLSDSSAIPNKDQLRKKRVSFQEEVQDIPPLIGYEDEGTQTETVEPTELEEKKQEEPVVRKLSLVCNESSAGPIPENLIPELIERLR